MGSLIQLEIALQRTASTPAPASTAAAAAAAPKKKIVAKK